jgi:hypothetical protein
MQENYMASLLRPHQRVEMESEKESLQAKLKNPNIEDKGAVQRQLNRMNQQIETQTPRPFLPTEIDSAVKKEAELREKILVGMPSQEEMRKSPPGAIGKHMRWEKQNKKNLEEWKNLKLRLNHEDTDPDVANFERFRPTSSSLNMDNAHIPGNQYFLPPQSEQYRDNFDKVFPNAPGAKKEKKKRQLSPEAKAAASARMSAMHAAKKQAQPAQEA